MRRSSSSRSAATRTRRRDKIDAVLDRVDDVQQAHPRLFIGEFGDASAVSALDTVFAEDLEKAGLLSLPITLIILVVAFGALVAAGIPLLLALTAVFATFGLGAVVSQVMPLAEESGALVLLIGLAVGVDYSMFYLKREREERAAGRSERAAIEAAAATSGHSVLVSGLTVMVAMAGLFLTRDATFASFGLATMIVVAIAMLGSLTVLPALLSKLGDSVDRLRVPFVGRLRRDNGEGRFWGAVIDRVLRRPVLSVVLAGGLLLALAVPALQLRWSRRGRTRSRSRCPSSRPTTGCRTRSPARRCPPTSSSRRRTSTPRRSARRSTSSSSRRSRAAGCTSRSRSTSTATRPSRTSRSRSTGREPTPRRSRRSPSCATRSCPQTVGALPNAETGVTGVARSGRTPPTG